jgi:hypothetical protein
MFTPTMARIYLDQGHHEKAAEIYRYLLQQEPGREDLAQKLARIEKTIAEQNMGLERIRRLVSRWIRLSFQVQNLKRLTRKTGNQETVPALKKISAFVESTTGVPPTPTELSRALTRYFVLNEIKEHILMERKKA